MRMWKRMARIITANSSYLLLGGLLFVGSALLGYLNSALIQETAEQLMEQLQKIADKIGNNGSPLYTFWVIFQNNVMASLSMLGLGVFFGLFPILALTSNGFLLGFMLKTFALKGVSPLPVLVVGILPHGIIEIFAVILAAAIGIKYGFYVIRMMVNMFLSERRRSIFKEFKDSLQDLPFIVVSLICMLFIAAVIESTITPLLIHIFIGNTGGIGA